MGGCEEMDFSHIRSKTNTFSVLKSHKKEISPDIAAINSEGVFLFVCLPEVEGNRNSSSIMPYQMVKNLECRN